MANVLDLRRRIRSVKNTRQITKAMKMVSAAKLRRAQERALAARPYARMIVSVLESLRRRVDLYDEKTGIFVMRCFDETGEARPAHRHLGRQGFAGAFNANILKTAYQFINGNPDREIDIEAVGRKGRDQVCAAAIRRLPIPIRPTRTARRARSAARARAKSKSPGEPPRPVGQARNVTRPRSRAQHHLPLHHEEIDARLHRLQRVSSR